MLQMAAWPSTDWHCLLHVFGSGLPQLFWVQLVLVECSLHVADKSAIIVPNMAGIGCPCFLVLQLGRQAELHEA